MNPHLEAALAWSKKGAVFPCSPGTKKPLKGSNGLRDATTDEATIRALWAEHPDANVAFVPGSGGYAVVDTDPPDGEANWQALEAEHGPVQTFTVRTPRGGLHRYFKGTLPSSAGKLAPHVDVRSEGGYVLVPPSVTADGAYALVPGAKAAPLPSWVAEALARRAAPVAADPGVVLDRPKAVGRAIDYLKHDAPAVEGEGGDARTFVVAAKVRELGISEDKALELMLEHYNRRCDPPWEPDELAVKVANAYRYAQNEAGCYAVGDASETFKQAAKALGLVKEPAGPVPFRDVLKRAVAPVAELIPGLLERGVVTFLAGPGGVHKSRLALQWGLCLDAGAAIFGRPVERATFAYLSCEDHADEVARRAQAITARLQLPDDGPGQFYDLTGEGEGATLAVIHDSGECEPTEAFARLLAWLRSMPGHKFVVVDSTYNVLRFEGSAKINEGGVKAAIALLQRLCDEADATLLMLWHPSQAGMDRGDAGGWSVAWYNTPRAKLSLTAADKEGQAFTLATEKRNHGPKGKPITLHWSAGALLPLTDVGESEDREALISAVVAVATTAAETGAPIQKGSRRLLGWQMTEVEHTLGRRPSDTEVKEALASALPRGLLSYVSKSRHRAAGYYPPNQDRAVALALVAKQRAKSAEAEGE